MDAVLSSIPAWMWLAGAGAGLVAFFFASIFSHFPPLKPYMMFIKPLGGLAALLCVFMYGGSGVQAMWEEKVRLAQEEADRKAAMAQQLNKDLEKERKKKATRPAPAPANHIQAGMVLRTASINQENNLHS